VKEGFKELPMNAKLSHNDKIHYVEQEIAASEFMHQNSHIPRVE
jgi:hypothetical protein